MSHSQDHHINNSREYQTLNKTSLQVGSNTEEMDLYNKVEKCILRAIDSKGGNVGPLGQAVLNNKNPISSLGLGPYFQSSIPEDKLRNAYETFTNITGYQPLEINKSIINMNHTQKEFAEINLFYLFFPSFILFTIIIWVMVIQGSLNWVAGLFLTILVFIILYSFVIAYRIQLDNFHNKHHQEIILQFEEAQTNYENSLAYWPRGLFEVASNINQDIIEEDQKETNKPNVIYHNRLNNRTKRNNRI